MKDSILVKIITRNKNMPYNEEKENNYFFFLFWAERSSMLEARFKTELIKKLKKEFDGCLIFHLNPREIQGSPDLLILYKDKWAALEGKRTKDSPVQPNQPYYINLMNSMSYAAFIYPENVEVIMNELQFTFRNRGR